MSCLLILDGNSLLHRAYYALPDWRNRSGEATAGVYGFLAMMFKVILDLKPTHLAVVFDCPEPTFRHAMYVGYQTNREKERQISEDIWGQVEKLVVVLEKMEIPVFRVPGFEADDVAGTLTKQATYSEVILITGDKDYMQLVNDKVSLFMPQKGLSDGIMIDGEKVLEKMGVHPDQIIDYKGLVGDTSDNYPGVTGIGPKTAVHLLAEYGSLEKIYKNLSRIDEKLRVKLARGHEGARLSLKLATIRTDVPVTLQLNKAEVPTQEKMLQVLNELGYKSLIKRMGGKPDESSANPRLFE